MAGSVALHRPTGYPAPSRSGFHGEETERPPGAGGEACVEDDATAGDRDRLLEIDRVDRAPEGRGVAREDDRAEGALVRREEPVDRRRPAERRDERHVASLERERGHVAAAGGGKERPAARGRIAGHDDLG